MVPSGHQACTGRSTYRTNIKIGEADAVCGKLVQVGGLNAGIAMKPEVSVPLVIGYDQDDIGMGFGVRSRSTTGKENGKGC